MRYQISTTAAFAEKENTLDFKIYPNPSNNYINVDIQNPNRDYSIEIYSMLGQQLLISFKMNVIDISSLTKGIYLIKLTRKNKVWTSKLRKQ